MTVAFAAVCLPALAGATTWSVPGVGNIKGKNGTHFASDIKVLNRGATTAAVTFAVVLAQAGATPASVAVGVAPGKTLVVTNVLKHFWNLSERSGTIRITAGQPLLIAARTYNDADPSGTYGQSIEAVRDEDVLLAGDVGHAIWVSESSDAAKGFRSNVGVFLPLAASSVDIVLLDAGGHEVGRRTITGGPRVYQDSVSAIVPGGLPMGRAEFRVGAGKAIGYVSVLDNVTGDAIMVQTSPRAHDATDVVINGVAHTPGRAGTYWETDVRLFNAGFAPAAVTVSPLGVSQSLPATAIVNLAAGEVKEIGDVLKTLFGATDGATGALRFTSDSPAMLLGRTSNIHPNGAPGTYGASQPAVPFAAFVAPGATGTLIGLRQSSKKPGYRTNIGVLAGGDGTTASVVLKDANGVTVATRPGAITLNAYRWTQPSLGDLFPQTAIPDNAVLEITPTAGALDAYASIIDNATGDPVDAGAAPFEAYTCALPDIFTFAAESDALAAAGTVKLHWYTNADKVSISPGGGNSLASYGEADVNVAATTTFTITVTNSCGTATAKTTVALGPPAVTAVSASSAQPGQVVTLTVANLGSSQQVDAVVFKFALGPPFTVDTYGRTASGGVRVTVPFLADHARPLGYWAGPATVSVFVDGAISAGVPLTVAPLSFAGNPVSAYRALLDEAFAAIRQNVAAQATVPGNDKAQPIVVDAVAKIEALLRKMGDDLAASTTATEPIDVPTPSNPTPMTTAVTRQSLGVLMALMANLKASKVPGAQSASVTALDGGTCIAAQIPALPPCVATGGLADVIERIGRASSDKLGGAADYAGPILDVAKLEAAGLALTLMQVALDARNIMCLIYPVYLKSLQFSPTGVPYPLKEDKKANKVKLMAQMTAIKKTSEVGDYLKDLLVKSILAKLAAPEAKPFADALISAVQNVFPAWKGYINGVIGSLAVAYGQAQQNPPPYQIGTCDLAELPVATRQYLEYSGPNQGEDDFFFRLTRKGWRRGSKQTEIFSVKPKIDNFLFTEGRLKSFGTPSQENVHFDVPLRIGKGFPVTTCSAIWMNNVIVSSPARAPGPTVHAADDTPISFCVEVENRPSPPVFRYQGDFGIKAQVTTMQTGPRSFRVISTLSAGPELRLPGISLAVPTDYQQEAEPGSPEAVLKGTCRAYGSLSVTDQLSARSGNYFLASSCFFNTHTANDELFAFKQTGETLPVSFDETKLFNLTGASDGWIGQGPSIDGCLPAQENFPPNNYCQFSAGTVVDFELIPPG